MTHANGPTRRRGTAAAFVTALLAACAPAADPAPQPDPVSAAERIDAIADEFVAENFERSPEWATIEGYPGADLVGLTDNSIESIEAWTEYERELLEKVRAIDPVALRGTPAEITYGFLVNTLESSLGQRVCRMELWNVSPTWTGWHSGLAFLASVQPVGTAEEREAALARFAGLPDYVDTEIENLREGLRLGYSAPKNNVRATIEQIDNLVRAEGESSPFFGPARRVDDPEYRAEFAALVNETINPALARYRDFLQQEYLPAARTEIAVAANPNGQECYDASVRAWTSIGVPAREIHETGLRQMEAIQTEMREIAERSFGTSDVQALLQRLKTDPEYTFDSREQMVEYARSAVARAEAAVPEWFGLVPDAEVIVQPYPAFREKSAPGGEYMSAPDDLSRPAVYMINTYRPETHSIAGLESTAFHETYPGHHLQIAIAKERTTTHPITKYFGPSGFSEGWGLYSERLADEMGLFSGDIDRLGLLSNEALRAARLVVDAGMHALGWSRQQAIDYILAHTAESEASATAEVDRYIAVPGQATSYMLGALEIRRLRETAERELGDDFDIGAFHDQVLGTGALTLPMLREKIEAWIAAGGAE